MNCLERFLMTLLLAGGAGALANPASPPLAGAAADLAILPAAPGAWRTVFGHWDQRIEYPGQAAVVAGAAGPGAPNPSVGAVATTGADGRREAFALEWKDTWFATLRFESAAPLDLRPYREGSLELDIDVSDLAQGGLRLKVACGEGCERSVSLLEPARALAGKGWQHLSLALRCFQRDGGDFSRVTLPFAVEAGGQGRISVANVRLTRSGAGSIACPDFLTESVTPAMLAESWSLDWWLPRHEQKRQEARELVAAGQAPQLVFIGDSITQGWENEGRQVWASHYARYHALNLGFGGDRTENLLWRLQHGALDGLAPRAVVLMIGTNNTGHRAENPETTAAGIRRVLDEIRQRLPAAQVLLLAVFPREERADGPLRRLNARVNEIIGGYADGRSVHYLNLGSALTHPDGTVSRDVMPDLLHLSEKGHALWQRAMDPVLTPLLDPTR